MSLHIRIVSPEPSLVANNRDIELHVETASDKELEISFGDQLLRDTAQIL